MPHPLFQKLKERFKRDPTDLIGMDFGASGIKAVRMHRSGSELHLTAAGVFAPIESVTAGQKVQAGEPLSLPHELKAKYAALAVTGRDPVIKLLSFPGHFDGKAEEKLVESMGLGDPDLYRIGYKVIETPGSRSESRVLAVALPEAQAASVTSLLATSLPAPFSLEISSLASMAAFLHGTGRRFQDEVVAALEFGSETSVFAIFNKGNLALIRRFETGTRALLNKIADSLGVDSETAESVADSGTFDLGESVRDLLGGLVKQLIVSRDFIERRENCHVSRLCVAGGLIRSHNAMAELRHALGVEVMPWSALDGLTVSRNAVPESLAGREWRLSAAVGACLGVLVKS